MKQSLLRILCVFFLYFTFTLTYSAQPIEVEKAGITYRLYPSNKTAEIISVDKSIQVATIESIEYENAQYYVTSIGKNAFENCTELYSVTIGNSVNSIGEGAFQNCGSITSVNIPNSVTSMGNDAFNNCISLTSVTIPNSITSIKARTFTRCSSLISVNIPNSVTTIYGSAFQDCISLKEVIFGNSVASIGGSAFQNCINLTEVAIPNSVTTIGGSAFWDCSSLKDVTIGNSVTSIGGAAFQNCKGLTEVAIPNSVTIIGGSAFGGCTNLKKVNISDMEAWCSIKYQDDASANPLWPGKADLYLNGELVENLTIPNSVRTLGFATFVRCPSIISVKFSEGFERINGGRNFQSCDNLERIILPSTLKAIAGFAFYDCKSLVYVECLAMEPPSLDKYIDYNYIDSYPFANSYPEYIELHVPKGCKEAYSLAEGWSYFTQIIDDLDVSGIEDIMSDSLSLPTSCNIYNLQGICLKRNATEDFVNSLPHGIYIIGDKKVLIK